MVQKSGDHQFISKISYYLPRVSYFSARFLNNQQVDLLVQHNQHDNDPSEEIGGKKLRIGFVDETVETKLNVISFVSQLGISFTTEENHMLSAETYIICSSSQIIITSPIWRGCQKSLGKLFRCFVHLIDLVLHV